MNTFRSMWNQLSKPTQKSYVNYLIVVILVAVMMVSNAVGLTTNLLKGQLIFLCAYIILAVSLNLTVGILGELSLGHAGFMCVGAFTSAIFSKSMVGVIDQVWIRFPLALILGALLAALFGFVIGIPVLRLKGDYLAIVTLAFGEIIKNIANSIYLAKDANGFQSAFQTSASMTMAEGSEWIVNGPLGIVSVPKDSTFLVGAILVLITLFIVQNLVNSRAGRAIMSIRDNRIAAESVGIHVTRYKMLAFTISAALAGMAGALYAHGLSTVTSSKFNYNESIMILVFVVLGGIGNIRGSIIAAIVLKLIPEYMRGLSDYRMLFYAIVLIVVMIFNWSPALITWREKVWANAKQKLPTIFKKAKKDNNSDTKEDN